MTEVNMHQGITSYFGWRDIKWACFDYFLQRLAQKVQTEEIVIFYEIGRCCVLTGSLVADSKRELVTLKSDIQSKIGKYPPFA